MHSIISDYKCHCAHDLWDQRTGNNVQNGTESDIICEINGDLQVSGSCATDEYCAGPSSTKDSICGKENMCTKKGVNVFQYSYNH